MGGWPWPLDSVQGWFESFWATIERDIWDTFSGIQKSIGVMLTTIWTAAVWVKNELLTVISDLDLFILTAFGTLFGWISKSIQNATDAITGFFGGVHRALGLIWSNLSLQLWNASQVITSSITGAVSEIKAWFDAGLTRVDFSLMAGITSMRSEFATVAALQRSEIDKLAGELETFNTEGLQGLQIWIDNALRGFWVWLTENVLKPVQLGLERGLAVVTTAVKAQIENIVNFMETTAPRSPIGAVPAALAVLAVAAGTGVAITASGVALEALHPLKNMGVSAITGFIEKITGTDVIAAALIGTFVGIILKEPLQQELNVVWRRTIPEVEQVLMLHTRAVFDTTVFENLMARLGYSDGLITSFWDAHWKLLDIDQAQILLWRGRITREDFTRVMSLTGFHPADMANLLDLTELIPGPGELVTFQVREAFREEFRTPAPPDFVGFMSKQGFSEFWATTFWTSHWVLVPINQLYEMFHRRIITAAILREQLVFHDFRPEWVNKLVELSYRLPTRVEARFLYDIIGLEDPEIRQILEAEGFAPLNVDRMMFYVKGFRLRALYGRMENTARRFFREGLFSEEQFTELLEGGNFAPEVIEVDLKLAMLERDFETKRDLIQAYREGFRKGLVSEEEFLEDLLALGLQVLQAGIIVAREKTRLTPKIKERLPG